LVIHSSGLFMTPILRNMIADSDIAFARRIADGLRAVPGVTAVALGGSRAAGTHRPDSDWDFSLYYRGQFEPDDLRRTGWPGQIFPLGGWGGGVFNGGAWLRVDGTPVDIHYRDLNDVEFRLAEARDGRFRIERLPFHLAGIPTYIVVAELAVHVVLYDRAGAGPGRARRPRNAR
jgi:predicted nucleotidyltransferase